MKGMSLDNLASQEELDTLKQVDSMTHEPGFGPNQGGGESLADLGFSSLDLSGQSSPIGDLNAQGGIMGGFQNSLEQQQMQQAQATPDWGDIAIESAGKGMKATGILLKELLKSALTRTADDLGYFGRNAMIAGIPAGVLGIIFLIMAGPTGWAGFGFFGLGGIMLLAGIGTSSVGAIVMGVAAEMVAVNPSTPAEALDLLEETVDQSVDAYVENIEDSVENIVSDDLLDELNDILGDLSADTDFDGQTEYQPDYTETVETVELPEMPDFDELDKQVESSKKTLTRVNLLTTFLPYFMQRTPQFRDTQAIVEGSATYDLIRATIVKAIANLQNTTIDKVTQQCISIEETFFSYKVLFERVKKMKNTKDIAAELETYFRATVEGDNMTDEEIKNQRLRIKVTVESVGDNWEITINKGTSGIITMGDILAGEREYNYFKSEKNALPYVAGITELGSVLLDDAGNALEMLITGKQRSGKSWYVNSILTSLVTFNTPEDVALIIADPKNSTMFNTLALFPHVIGIHDGDNILEIFREVIDIEAPKRAELLREARCENIKDYNKMNPDKKMPYIFIVIDEVLSVKDSLAQVKEGEKDADAKARIREFTSSLLVILSKLPYIGVGIILVPHRATGVIDKTARTLLKLKAAVMAEDDEIDETLGEKIDRRLTAPGDIAVRIMSMTSAKYVRGPAVADDDRKTAETLRRIAKGFYTMGVEVPNWKHLRESYNRDDEFIRSELFGDTTHVKY